jgi:hypothetical protein
MKVSKQFLPLHPYHLIYTDLIFKQYCGEFNIRNQARDLLNLLAHLSQPLLEL